MGTCIQENQQLEERISLKHCRKVLSGAKGFSDDQLSTLRDQLYALATITIEHFLEESRTTDQRDGAEGGCALISESPQHRMDRPPECGR